MSLNNIDVKQVEEYQALIQKDPKEAEAIAKIEGEWVFEEDGPQFKANVKVRDGTVTLATTHPNFAGPGKYPSPMAYGLFWFAACYSSTFMTDAAMQGVKIDHLKTRVEADLNYLSQFDLGNNPLVSEYRIFIEVKSSAAEKKIIELKDHALRTCMGMYTITHAIRLVPELKIIR